MNTIPNRNKTYQLILVYLIIVVNSIHFAQAQQQQYTRGIGIYPGDPKESFAPTLKPDLSHYRNLALFRAAYQSSAYDYNLTAQLITDGMVETKLPGWIVTSTSTQGILPRDGREHVLDRHPSSQLPLEGPNVWLQVQLAGNYAVPTIDSVNFQGSLNADTLQAKPWTLTLTGSEDGVKWEPVGSINGSNTLPGNQPAFRYRPPPGQKLTAEQAARFRRYSSMRRRSLNYTFKLSHQAKYRCYRLTCIDPNVKTWTINDLNFYSKGKIAEIGGPYAFTSAWKSGGSATEWVYVDLGATSTFNEVKLHWLSPALEGSIQSSSNAKTWTNIAPLTPPTVSQAGLTDLKLKSKVTARYVRVLMTKASNPDIGYVLSEMEVMGTGGLVAQAHEQQQQLKLQNLPPKAIQNQNQNQSPTLNLSGGAWKIQRASETQATAKAISQPGYDDSKWLVATVPGTTLVSYLNDGAVPEPNYGDNNLAISDSYFYADFWYRDQFEMPAGYKNKRVWLNFDGINWKADIYLNGDSIGHIDGAFTRGKFDVTDHLNPSAANVLAVRVIRNETPGFPTEQNRNSTDANGGEIGADNPTFHASIGWDWIPTIRGRNTGIWNTVYLSASGAVTLENPVVTSTMPLPDTSTADVKIGVTLKNHTTSAVRGVVSGKFGDANFQEQVSLAPRETRTVELNPGNNPALRLKNPKLWWPNGYGGQNLYPVSIAFSNASGNEVSDQSHFKAGVRMMTYSDTGNLKIYVNGRRFIARGGNMGFSEDLLRYRSREYNIAVGYHKAMNFNMIRNWVGQVGDDAFFDACNRYGILIWQDFWLANPSDGPEPNNTRMFLANLKDFVERICNHPSLGLFVGRNEGNPPPVIQKGIDSLLPQLAPSIKYIPNSASGPVSGGGPYALQPMKFYFENRATPKMHSEMGMPDIMSAESFKLAMPDSAIWPQSRLWGVHDFTLDGAQNGATFNRTIEQTFGRGKNLSAKTWLSIAAWTEYQGYRAMFEAQSKNRMGLLVWMTHPSWPSLAWQSYDYYFEPTGAYFGSKCASEPLHIQWNPLSDSVEVVNYSVADKSLLRAQLKIYDLAGHLRFTKEAGLSAPIDSRILVMAVSVPTALTGVYFVRLALYRGAKLVSRNEYCRGAQPDSSGGFGDLKAVLQLPKTKVSFSTQAVRSGSHWSITTTLSNKTSVTAFNVRLQVVGSRSGERVLPVIFNDNYFTLLPGESRVITMQAENEDTRGETPVVTVEGLNVTQQ